MWEALLPAIIQAGASIIGGGLSAQGSQAAADAQSDAAKQAAELQKNIYYDQRGLAMPAYLTGGAATNKLGALFGIAPQDYSAAFAGNNNGLGQMSGGYNPANYGAGQPVAGHSGGGGPSVLGGAAGYVLGGPIGGALGGLIRNGGDNWQTVATSAPQGFDYATYLQQPDLAAEWAKPDIKALFGNNPDAYAAWHYNQFGKSEGRTLSPLGGNTTTQPVGGGTVQTPTGSGTPTNPLGEFYSSPYFNLSSTLNNDQFSKIKGQLGAAGKSISGAGEKRYAKTLAGNTYGAFGDYTNGLRSLAGMNPVATTAINSASSQYGTNAGNALMSAGNAQADGLKGAYQGWGQGISGATSSFLDFGKKQGWSGF